MWRLPRSNGTCHDSHPATARHIRPLDLSLRHVRRHDATDDYRGVPEDAEVVLAKWERGRQPDGIKRWNHATLDEVRDGLHQTGYPPERVRFVPGDVLETVTPNSHDRIAFLRLDTDWHASTKHELECLYGRLVVGGVLVIDDYGRWRGSRKATDEFLETLGSDAPLLVRTSGERVCVKLR